MHIYLDETGNLTKSKEKYFIVGSFTVGDPKRIENAFRRWQKSKFPKKLKGQAEVKFNNSSLDDAMRRKTLQYLVSQDIRIFYTYLSTMNIPDEYMRKDKVHESGLLYLEIVGATLELYLPLTTKEFRVVRDQRTTKGMSFSSFHETLKTKLLPKMPAKTLFQIEALDSTSSAQVQVADWVCGALARYYEKKTNGQEFFNILKPNIIEGKELFAKLWKK